MFSIIIPTWNNLEFVRCCVESIRANSAFRHQILLHINDGGDGTLAWAKAEGIGFTHSPDNVGICIAVNQAAGLATADYIVYMNDDMYVCPGWDAVLYDEIKSLGTDLFMLSSTMIEPRFSGNPCVIHKDFGTDPTQLKKDELLATFASFQISDWNGSTWPPNIVHRKYWHITGGYSIELSPGMSSDDDFAMKMWTAGCRVFKGCGASRVYHFQSKSTHRIVKNNGRKQFLMKWGINQSTFNKLYTRRGTAYKGPLAEPDPTLLKREQMRAWLKRKII